MEESFGSRLKHAWNTLLNKDPTMEYRNDLGISYSYRPDRPRLTRGNERSIITAIYNRISLDVASVDIKHVRLDANERYVDTMPSKLNNCFSLESNIDQTGRALIQDIIISMLDEGVVAVVPIDTDTSIYNPGTFDIETMRTAKILEWYPRHVNITQEFYCYYRESVLFCNE